MSSGFSISSIGGQTIVTIVDPDTETLEALTQRLLALRIIGPAPTAFSDMEGVPRTATLTPREKQVLELLLDGHTNKRVAIELGISFRTVEVHRQRLMEKVGARNSFDLAKMVWHR